MAQEVTDCFQVGVASKGSDLFYGRDGLPLTHTEYENISYVKFAISILALLAEGLTVFWK